MNIVIIVIVVAVLLFLRPDNVISIVGGQEGGQERRAAAIVCDALFHNVRQRKVFECWHPAIQSQASSTVSGRLFLAYTQTWGNTVTYSYIVINASGVYPFISWIRQIFL